jgi:hypothetical protein
MIGEQHFSSVNIATGILLAVVAFMLLIRPESFARSLKAFPRSRMWGILLAAVALLWSAYYIDQMTLGGLSRYKWLLYILTPLSLFFVVQYLDELLASRALGGILMLYPTVMVESAKWHPSSLRYILLVLAYIFVALGIWLILSPFKFRIWTDAIMAENGRQKVAGVVTAVLAAALLYTGIIHW